MNMLIVSAFISTGLVAAGGCWLGWQLLRQNGRILLRLDELEKRLDVIEFGNEEEPQGLPLGSEAPAFELPGLSGERKSLAQFRGQPVLLVFFNPYCSFCREMMPKLAALETARGRSPSTAATNGKVSLEYPNGAVLPEPLRSGTDRGPQVLVLTTGDAEKNRQCFAAHKVGCPVLLQNDGEVAKVYHALGTPSGYLISHDGKIASALAMGADTLLGLVEGKPPDQPDRPLTPSLSPNGGEGVRRTDEGETLNPADRFKQRSLTNSKINRDGLKAGTLAPDFTLPRLDGKGDLSLSELRGKRVLLVFSSPGCEPCNALAPELEDFHLRQVKVGRVTPCAPQRDGMFRNGTQGTDAPYPISVVMISKGEPKENRAKVKEHGLTFPIVLQQQWEISRRYAMFATPVAYLINEQGVTEKDVAVGADQIQTLLTETVRLDNQHKRFIV